MVDLTVKLESPQVYSNDHLSNHSVEFWNMFQCTRKSTDLLAIGSSSVSLQQLLISKNLSQVYLITMSDLHSCSSWKQNRWNHAMTYVRIHQVSTSAIYLYTNCVAGRSGVSDYPLPDKSDKRNQQSYEQAVHLGINIDLMIIFSISIPHMNLSEA